MALNVRLGWGLEIFLLVPVNEHQVAALLLSERPALLHGMFLGRCGLWLVPRFSRLLLLRHLDLDCGFRQMPGQFLGLGGSDTDHDLISSKHPGDFRAVLRYAQKHIVLVARFRRAQEHLQVPASSGQIDFHFGTNLFIYLTHVIRLMDNGSRLRHGWQYRKSATGLAAIDGARCGRFCRCVVGAVAAGAVHSGPACGGSGALVPGPGLVSANPPGYSSTPG